MIKILLAKTVEAAKEIKPCFTIEAEYGEVVVEGSKGTFAHHVDGWDSAPALQSPQHYPRIEANDTILVSHIDLDTICGYINLVNGSMSDQVKECVNFIDTNGQHHLAEAEKRYGSAVNYIYAYLGHTIKNRVPFTKELISDVYEYVHDTADAVFPGSMTGMVIKPADEKLVSAGRALIKEREEYAQIHTADISENIRLIIADVDAPFALNSCYIINGVETNYVVVFNKKFGSITLSTTKDYNCVKIMQNIFGDKAGGHKGIAGTPRGERFTEEDAIRVFEYVDSLK